MTSLTDAFFPDYPEIDGVDFDALRGWMDGRSIGRGPITDIDQLVGGTQNVMVRFNRGDDRYVLRRPPIHKRANSDVTMQREARVLGALGGSPVPHPRLIASCPETWVLGASFYLATWVEGFNPTVIQPDFHMDDCAAEHPTVADRMGRSHVEALAHLGNVDWQRQGLRDFGKPDGWLARQVPRWRSHYEAYLATDGYTSDDLIGVDVIGDWLARRLPPMGEPGIVHGDCHLANTLFEWDSPELAALVDWELATIGDPLLDLGWVLATNHDPDDADGALHPNPLTVHFPHADDLIAHYADVSGRNVEHVWWYAVLACWKLAILIEGTWVRHLEGKATEEIGARLHANAISLLSRAERFMLRQP